VAPPSDLSRARSFSGRGEDLAIVVAATVLVLAAGGAFVYFGAPAAGKKERREGAVEVARRSGPGADEAKRDFARFFSSGIYFATPGR